MYYLTTSAPFAWFVEQQIGFQCEFLRISSAQPTRVLRCCRGFSGAHFLHTSFEMRPVMFRFDRDKLVHALTYFSQKGVADLTKLKAAKLIYFLDKTHLWRQGRPIVGGSYYCMNFGPVPGQALQTMNDAIDAAGLNLPFVAETGTEAYLEVREDGLHPRFVAKQDFDPEVFSRSELQVLDEVFQAYGHLSAGRLVELTHDDPTWRKPNEKRGGSLREDIPYELFFEDATADVRQIWTLIKAEQEDRCSDDYLET